MRLVSAALLCVCVQGVHIARPDLTRNDPSRTSSARRTHFSEPFDGVLQPAGSQSVPGFRFIPRTSSRTSCGIPTNLNRLIDGTNTVPGQFPWLAGLVFRDEDFVFCAASVVSDQFVVTAAHCVRIYEPADLDILVGKHKRDQDPNEVRLQVVEIIKHPDYIPFTNENDVALLRLDSSLQPLFDQPAGLVRPVCLPQTSCDVAVPPSCRVSQLATIAGWGLEQPDTFNFPVVAQEKEVPIMDNRNCKRRFHDFPVVKIVPSMVCAAFELGGADSCQGDSGGPLMLPDSLGTYSLEGIVSFGRGCGEVGFPGVYTRVSAFTPWIEGIIFS